MTKQEKEAGKLILAWLAKHSIKPVSKLRHVHPRCYVIGYAAPSALIVAAPWMDSEPQCKAMNMTYPLSTIHTFDTTLKQGDWCATAYVRTEGAGYPVAVAWRDKT